MCIRDSTHATESYLPQSGSNFHSTGEENTVRDVGNTLAASLEAEGISVVHDKTLHDNPSYNNSYNRSYVLSLIHILPRRQSVFAWRLDEVKENINYAGYDGWTRVDADMVVNGVLHRAEEDYRN